MQFNYGIGSAAIALAGLTAIALPAQAADHTNLEEGLPTEVEDAYPIHYQGIEVQTEVRFETLGDGAEALKIEPRLEWGFAPNWQGRVTLPFNVLAEDDENALSAVGLEVFYNFNTEGIHIPAFAVSLGAEIPTEDDSGVELTLKGIMTKSIGRGNALDRLHLNVGYTFNTEAHEGERDGRLSAVLGYSRRLSPETMFVSDIAFEQEEQDDENSLILEAGLRHQVSPLSVLSVGTGVGLTEDSPDFRLTFGWQQAL